MRRELIAAVAAVAVLLAGAATPAQARCGVSPRANGTGYVPPRAGTASLPSDNPRPGPDILYRRPASAPQLRNTGVWRAVPIMVSGATAYRQGEFLYQDWLYDDRALARPAGQVPQGNSPTGYPADKKYAGNAADIVEVRVKPLELALAIRITYNSMVDPNVVAATIGLGDSAQPYAMPHNGGVKERAQVFVTAHGCSGDVVNAAGGKELSPGPTVSTDLARRQVQVLVPYAAFDPRGQHTLRVAAAAGLWDAESSRYLRPDPSKPAFFNVAFRKYGDWHQNTWMDDSQNAALAAGDMSPLYAEVDLDKLAARVTDDSGVPQTGPINRILVSHYEPVQGRGNDQTEPDVTKPGGACSATSCTSPCELPACTPTYSGRLQPYAVYVPPLPAPSSGYGLVFSLHGASSNYNHFEGGGPTPPLSTWQMWAEAGRPSIFIQANARGPHLFYQGLAEVDEFEAWADIAARYQIDPRHTILTGSSMGGYGAYKLAVTYPDLFNAVMPNVPAVGSAASKHSPFLSAALGPPDPVWLSLLASLRNVPVTQTAGLFDPLAPFNNTSTMAATLDKLGYRADAWWFNGNHEEYRYWIKDTYSQLSKGLANDRNPTHVTYVVNAGWNEPSEFGLNTDHAYWLSGLKLRDQTQQTGKIDVVSDGSGLGDPSPTPVEPSAGTSSNGSTPWMRQSTGWGPAPAKAKANALSITATNIAAVTINVDRAHVGCDAKLSISSDGPIKITLVGDFCQRVTSQS